jgi:hypothetical protein
VEVLVLPEVAKVVQADVALNRGDEIPALGAQEKGINERPIGEQAADDPRFTALERFDNDVADTLR